MAPMLVAGVGSRTRQGASISTPSDCSAAAVRRRTDGRIGGPFGLIARKSRITRPGLGEPLAVPPGTCVVSDAGALAQPGRIADSAEADDGDELIEHGVAVGDDEVVLIGGRVLFAMSLTVCRCVSWCDPRPAGIRPGLDETSLSNDLGGQPELVPLCPVGCG
jgi:hypothetical protein